MSDRREKILDTALLLFNEKGIDGVTTRDIAKVLKISQGNLTYYFPAKSDLVFALTQEFTKGVDEALANHTSKAGGNALTDYFYQVEVVFKTHFKYKCIMEKRYGEIISSFPHAQQYLQEFLKIRFDAWEQLNRQLVKEKLAQKTLIEDTYPHSYILNMLALYWHQEFLIYFPNLSDKQKVEKALAIFFQAYKPYFTAKGLAVLKSLVKEMCHY
jgi:AcrR family transcriptional regulator